MTDQVIDKLLNANEGSRTLDGQVATALGWRRAEPKDGDPKSQNLWVSPDDPAGIVCPTFTSTLKAAYELANSTLPGSAFACVVEGGKARISIDDEVMFATTPALALCASIIKVKTKR